MLSCSWLGRTFLTTQCNHKNIRAVAEMKIGGSVQDTQVEMERHCQEGPESRNGQLTRKNGKVFAKPATPHRETAAKGKNIFMIISYTCREPR